ncbi:DUF1392 family protein [Nostoc sp. FACHB-888]|uniref:DUF1392 family protein n=1 Tax=Nostoc sp. FACHB-888 TaxID=2692842 RepID=UPI001685F6B0|nr:DUF1392 family protein [Nostoc sp. FACHB-888]MBD2249237.1 DUF1392 family protein [Nostoc sp. FACHB-888]
MTNLINSLETSWYISPPWGAEVPPPVVVSLLEKVYTGTPSHPLLSLVELRSNQLHLLQHKLEPSHRLVNFLWL